MPSKPRAPVLGIEFHKGARFFSHRHPAELIRLVGRPCKLSDARLIRRLDMLAVGFLVQFALEDTARKPDQTARWCDDIARKATEMLTIIGAPPTSGEPPSFCPNAQQTFAAAGAMPEDEERADLNRSAASLSALRAAAEKSAAFYRDRSRELGRAHNAREPQHEYLLREVASLLSKDFDMAVPDWPSAMSPFVGTVKFIRQPIIDTIQTREKHGQPPLVGPTDVAAVSRLNQFNADGMRSMWRRMREDERSAKPEPERF
jgi:hypothetical protein